MHGNVYAIRIKPDGKSPYWCLFNHLFTMHGKPGRSKDHTLGFWKSMGRGLCNGVITYKGTHRPSEAAMTMASVKKTLRERYPDEISETYISVR